METVSYGDWENLSCIICKNTSTSAALNIAGLKHVHTLTLGGSCSLAIDLWNASDGHWYADYGSVAKDFIFQS